MKTYCLNCMSEMDGDGRCPVCGSDGESQAGQDAFYLLAPGTVLANRYLVGRAIGQGGFGIVYIGRDLRTGVRVAIKEFYLSGYSNRNVAISNAVMVTGEKNALVFAKGRERLIEEAEVLGRYRSEDGVVDISDVFESNGTAYAVMEYLEGEDLSERLKRGVLSASWVCDAFAPIMDVLEKMHADGVFHRDISPSNIKVRENGSLCLMDFGSARIADGSANGQITVFLKDGYSPPEQYEENAQPGPWTDVYALCATMYECVAGVKPPASVVRVRRDNLKSLSELKIDAPRAFEQALRKGLSLNKGDRFQSIGELRAALVCEKGPVVRHLPDDEAAEGPSDKKTRLVLPSDAPAAEGKTWTGGGEVFRGGTPPGGRADATRWVRQPGGGQGGGGSARQNSVGVADHPLDLSDKDFPPADSEGRITSGGAGKPSRLSPGKLVPVSVLVAAVVIFAAVGLAGGFGRLGFVEPDGSSASSDKPVDAGQTIALGDISDKAVRKVFKDYVDADKDGALSQSELEAVNTLDLSGTGVASIGDLALLPNLESLDISECGSLKDADFASLASLTSLDAKGSGITSADFSSNGKLDSLQLDDAVKVEGLDGTLLRQQWQITSYNQDGYAGYGDERDGNWSASYAYDSDNRLERSELTEAGGGSTAHEYAYDSTGNLVSELVYDSEGNLTSRLRCTRDSRNVSAERYSSTGDLTKGYYGALDDQGRVVRINLGGSEFTVEYDYSDSNGNLVQARYHEGGAEYANSFEYSDDRLAVEDDGASSAARDIRYDYDDQGRCTGRTILSADGSDVLDDASFSYDEEGSIQCDGVRIEYDKHGNMIKRTFESKGRGKSGTSSFTYRRVFTPKDAADVYQPLEIGDPTLAPTEVLPCTINLMASQNALVRQQGPYVLRKI